MLTYNIHPIPSLRKYIKNIWIVECSNANKLEKMIPFGCMDLVYIFKERVTYRGNNIQKFKENQIIITGQVTQSYDFEFLSNAKIVGFGFYPHTAHLFTKAPAHYFTNKICNLSDVLDTTQLLNLLKEQNNIETTISLLQNFILREIQQNKSNNRKQEYLQYILKQIFHRKEQFDLIECQKELNISQRHIQNLFKEYVGVSPHLYANIIQFLSAVNSYQKDTNSLTDLALSLGYYDQSHFIRNFKRFTGLTPSQYFRKPPSFHEPFTTNEKSSLLYNSIPID